MPYKDIKIDSVVLGCTHYPHIKDEIKKALGGDVMIFDGGEGTAKETMNRLKTLKLLNASKICGEVKIECSSKEKDIVSLAERLLDEGLLH